MSSMLAGQQKRRRMTACTVDERYAVHEPGARMPVLGPFRTPLLNSRNVISKSVRLFNE